MASNANIQRSADDKFKPILINPTKHRFQYSFPTTPPHIILILQARWYLYASTMPFTQSVSRRLFIMELDMIEGSAYYRVITLNLTNFVSFKWWVFWVYFHREFWLTGSEIFGFHTWIIVNDPLWVFCTELFKKNSLPSIGIEKQVVPSISYPLLSFQLIVSWDWTPRKGQWWCIWKWVQELWSSFHWFQFKFRL